MDAAMKKLIGWYGDATSSYVPRIKSYETDEAQEAQKERLMIRGNLFKSGTFKKKV